MRSYMAVAILEAGKADQQHGDPGLELGAVGELFGKNKSCRV